MKKEIDIDIYLKLLFELLWQRVHFLPESALQFLPDVKCMTNRCIRFYSDHSRQHSTVIFAYEIEVLEVLEYRVFSISELDRLSVVRTFEPKSQFTGGRG